MNSSQSLVLSSAAMDLEAMELEEVEEDQDIIGTTGS
jgi:hypothetical protein